MAILAIVLAEVGPPAVAQPPSSEESPSSEASPSSEGSGPVPTDRIHRALRGQTVTVAEAEASDQVPPGAIRVEVRHPDGRPASGIAVDIGVMKQGGDRDKKSQTTDGAGLVLFSELPSGAGQAYRVNVPVDGAKYSSTPFRLPPERGYQVRVTLLPTTRDDRFILQYLNRTYLELRDGRLRIVQKAELANLGEETFVFPEEGKRIPLPKGALAFQTQPVMTDQRLVEDEGGFRLFGSIPPGRIDLLWAFDLPLEGTDLSVRLPLPFRTYRISVEADAPPGAELVVDGMPEAIVHTEKGNRFLVTQIQQRPDGPQLEALAIRLSGLPGPGPLRWFAVSGVVLFVLLGLVWFLRPPRTRASGHGAGIDLGAHKEALLAEVDALERRARTGDVGPKYRERRLREIETELALILRSEG
ncbi:MAG: hypothetical protein KC416_03125 [Myxococcales bacterium]|nr:hypothetical protein [Myxococcales bacterium]